MVEVSQSYGLSNCPEQSGFFEELPKEYRQIALESAQRQWEELASCVSVNKQYIDLVPIQESEFSTLVRENLAIKL